ncbi:MAG: guanylate kinase [Brevinemataceae bacterium]
MESTQRKIIVISGPSGVGKTTLYKRVLNRLADYLGFSISATTRKQRCNEKDNEDYYFITREEFEYLIAKGELIEWEELYNNYYGTLKSEIYRIWGMDKSCLLDVDVKGGLRIRKMFGDKAFLIFIAPPSMEILEKRLRYRGANDEDSLQIRLANASQEMDKKGLYDLVLNNEDIDQTEELLIKEIQHIIS